MRRQLLLRAIRSTFCFSFWGSFLGACFSATEPARGDRVVPSPLHRLTNREYLNALSDLFPSQAPALPPMPADALLLGFDNAAEVQEPSDVLIARFATIADAYAEGATKDEAALREWVHCDLHDASARIACSAQFVSEAGRRIFRRPLTVDEGERFVQRFQSWAGAIDFEAASRLTLSAFLQSPQFLYRIEPGTLEGDAPNAIVTEVEPYAMASRLSFFLWESTPDEELLGAAKADQLRTSEQIRSHAERMLADPKARRSLWSFHRQWLGLDRVLGDEHTARAPEIDPGWTASTALSASHESQLFVENVLSQGGTLRDLLTSRKAWVNGDLARIYGVSASEGGEPPTSAFGDMWQEVDLPKDQRAGILTRTAFLAGLSHRGGTSPPIRGNGVLLRLLCQSLGAPPPGADVSMPMARADAGPQTNRDLFEERTAPAACMGCHRSLNGVGFGFEEYDAAGTYQTEEHGLPIDARGTLYGTDVDGPFAGALALSHALAESRAVHRCATDRWVRYAFGRQLATTEAEVVSDLVQRFTESGGDVRALLLDIVSLPNFRLRLVSQPPEGN